VLSLLIWAEAREETFLDCLELKRIILDYYYDPLNY